MKLFYFLILMLMVACSSNPRVINSEQQAPKQEVIWVNKEKFMRLKTNDITTQQYKDFYKTSVARCKIESLKIQIPSPSCYSLPPDDCSGKEGFSKGWCEGRNRHKTRCDYTAVNAAKNSQRQVYKLCMELEGWTQAPKNNRKPEP